MKKTQRPLRTLRLDKETLKQLAPDALGQVAGGSLSIRVACGTTLNPEQPGD